MYNNIYEFFYDTISFPAGTAVNPQTIYKFGSQIADGVNKFIYQTNQTLAGVCPYTQMAIKGIYAKVFSNSGSLPLSADVEKIIKSFSLTILKNTTPVLQLPISKIGGSNQLDGFVSSDVAGETAIIKNGVAHFDNMYTIGNSNKNGQVVSGISFVKNETLSINMIAETGFTPTNAVSLQIGLFCDTYQDIN